MDIAVEVFTHTFLILILFFIRCLDMKDFQVAEQE